MPEFQQIENVIDGKSVVENLKSEVDELKKKLSQLNLENNRYHLRMAMCSCEDQMTIIPSSSLSSIVMGNKY